jgi:hypothetical protein
VANFNQGVYPSPQDCCYYGVGVVRLAPWDSWQQGWAHASPIVFDAATQAPIIAPAFRDVGEANRLDLDVRTKTNALPRYDGQGGEQAATETLEGIDVTLGLDCLNFANLLQALRGQLTNLPFSIPSAPSSNGGNGSGSGGISGAQSGWGYNWGNDWGGVNGSGFNGNPAIVNVQTTDPYTGFVSNSNAIAFATLPQGIQIAQIGAFIKTFNKPVALMFEGRNAATGAGTIVFIPKLKLGMTKRMPIISDDLAELTLSARVLHAGTQGIGNSPYVNFIYTT